MRFVHQIVRETCNSVFFLVIPQIPTKWVMLVKETVVLGLLVFLLIWVSKSNFQGRFFSKKTFQGDFVNKTLLDNQIKRIKDELYERIRTEVSLEKDSDVQILPSENKVTDHQSELEVNFTTLTEIFSDIQTINDTGDQMNYPGGQSGHGVDGGVNEGHTVETSDLGGGSLELEFRSREGGGSWRERQLKRVRRLRNVCSRHPERTSFIESEKRR